MEEIAKQTESSPNTSRRSPNRKKRDDTIDNDVCLIYVHFNLNHCDIVIELYTAFDTINHNHNDIFDLGSFYLYLFVSALLFNVQFFRMYLSCFYS